jgi:hypothetical protein
MRRHVAGARLALCLAVAFLAPAAAAHVPALRGRLIDLVNQSDLVVVGTVERVSAADQRLHDTTMRVEDRFIGTTPAAQLTFRGPTRFTPGRRFVFFLRRSGTGYECLQPSGTLFPARAADDALYRDTLTAIQRALRGGANQRAAALQAALLPALSSQTAQLRYSAVLEMAALAHHGLPQAERRSLERLAAEPGSDPAIRQLVNGLPSAAPPADVHPDAAPQPR